MVEVGTFACAHALTVGQLCEWGLSAISYFSQQPHVA